MKKFKKIVSFMLLVSMLSSIFLPIFCKEKTIFAEEKNNQRVIREDKDFVLKEDTSNGIRYLYLKTLNISNERLEEIFKISNEGKITTRSGIIVAISIIAFLYQVYATEMKPHFDLEREHKIKLQATDNGWIDITKYGLTMWYYKTYGQFKTGWHYDNYYEGWYYFSPEHNFMFDPRYSKSEWLSINNKWYWFNIGGKLKELNGWERYGDEWMYHIPGDYGALAGCLCKIGSKYYIFNYNGFMTYEGDTAPDLSKLGYSR